MNSIKSTKALQEEEKEMEHLQTVGPIMTDRCKNMLCRQKRLMWPTITEQPWQNKRHKVTVLEQPSQSDHYRESVTTSKPNAN